MLKNVAKVNPGKEYGANYKLIGKNYTTPEIGRAHV